MGEIVGAAVVSHVPPIVMPEDVRRELNNGEEISLVPGLHRPDPYVVRATRRRLDGLSRPRRVSRRSGTSRRVRRSALGCPLTLRRTGQP